MGLISMVNIETETMAQDTKNDEPNNDDDEAADNKGAPGKTGTLMIHVFKNFG